VRPIDYVDLVEPNLLVPGKKPVGNVRIDSGHYLASHLKFSVDFNSLSPIDLVSGKTLTKSGTPVIASNAKGRFVKLQKAGPDYFTVSTADNWSGPNTIFEAIFYLDTHDTNGSMILTWTNNGTTYVQIGKTDTAKINQCDPDFTSIDPDDGAWHHIFLGGFTDQTYGRTFVDGADDTLNETEVKYNAPSGSKDLNIGHYTPSAFYDWDGGISLIRLWEGISTGDALELTRDPYQLLIPA